MSGKLTDEDLDRFERALATLSGVAPRGWVVLDGALIHVGNIKSDGTVGSALHVNTSSHHSGNLEVGKAVSILLNDAGQLLYDVRRLRENDDR